MRQLLRMQTLWWALYATALFLIYHLLVQIAFLDLSWIALVIFIPVLFLAYFVIHPDERRQVIVFSLGFLMLDRALTRLDVKSPVAVIVGGLIAILVISLLARWYGKLRGNAIFALVLIAVLVNVSFNRDNLSVLNQFYVKWETDRLYSGDWVDYFPITLVDVNGDGKQEIVTYGSRDPEKKTEETDKPETEAERKALAEKLLPLQAEEISLYVFTWTNGELVPLKNEELSADAIAQIKQKMPADFPGFPYYIMKDGQLVPTVQRQSYAEGMLQVGTAPYRALLLDLQNIDYQLKQKQGLLDAQDRFAKDSKYQNISIGAGLIEGSYDGKGFVAPTLATKLLGTIRLPNGQEGLMAQGERISIFTPDGNGSLTERYTLTKEQISLANSEYITADIDQDGVDELLIGGSPSYILQPTAAGKWNILWRSAANDESFRFSAFASVGNQAGPQIIAQAKSWVSSYPLRYLSGFAYTPQGLEQQWRIYLPLMNIQVGDVDGDKENEIIATSYDTHRLLVLKQHDIPVLPIVSILFIGLFGYGAARRFRHV